ncbi:MAG: hypothetical protein R3E95_03940 [Thiolinea sp.]
MKPIMRYAVLMVSLLGLAACVDRSLPTPSGGPTVNGLDDRAFISKHAQLAEKDPARDAQTAITRNQLYFLCNVGRSATVPGLTVETFQAVRNHCPVQCLPGVTDAIIGPNHMKYLQLAQRYAVSWNQVMVNACR